MTKEELIKWREDNNLTQEQLARRLNKVVRTVQNWESGKHPVPEFIELKLKEITND